MRINEMSNNLIKSKIGNCVVVSSRKGYDFYIISECENNKELYATFKYEKTIEWIKKNEEKLGGILRVVGYYDSKEID